MRTSTRTISVIAIFTSLIIASDYALTAALNIKLMDTLVFSSSFAFGLRIGASIAILSELIWSTITPFGFFLPIMPYLIGGELLFAFAGYFASKFWHLDEISRVAPENLFFGALLAMCAFVWDFETNIASGLIAGAHSLLTLLAFEFNPATLWFFNLPHEISDFVFGSTLAPIVIVFLRKNAGRIKNQVPPEKSAVTTGLQGGN